MLDVSTNSNDSYWIDDYNFEDLNLYNRKNSIIKKATSFKIEIAKKSVKS